MRLFKKKHAYKDKDGNPKQGWNFYLENNGNVVAIRAAFPEDNRILSFMAEEVLEDK